MNIFCCFDFAGEDCEFEIRVRRNTVYETSIGEELRINCTVIFCNNSPPTVSWFKLGQSVVPVNVSSNSHIKIEWKKIDDSRGISFLVFKKILMSDSGEYQCQGGGSLGHNINVSVSGERFFSNSSMIKFEVVTICQTIRWKLCHYFCGKKTIWRVFQMLSTITMCWNHMRKSVRDESWFLFAHKLNPHTSMLLRCHLFILQDLLSILLSPTMHSALLES